MKTLNLPIVLLLLPVLAAAQSNNPTIAVCNGKQYICAADTFVNLCVNIIVNPAYPNSGIISEFEIDWGDGSAVTTVPGSLNPPSQSHIYNVGNFFGSCQYEKEYIIKLLTKHSDPAVDPTNSAFFLYIRNAPQANFNINPSPVCTGKPVTLNTTPCPAQGINYQFWNLGGGVTGTGPTFTDTFTTPGLKSIQHCVGNVCDTICSVRTLSVIDAAVAKLEADSGVLAGTNNPYKVCLDGGSATVRLDASGSMNVTKPYSWTISGSGWQWVLPPGTPTTSIARVRFTAPGTYTVTVRVNNDCGAESTQNIVIQVVQAPLLMLAPFPDTCVAVPYTPSPPTPNATYTINGVAQTFPFTLSPSPNPYIVEARLNNECGDQLLRDTIRILPPQDIAIVSPADLTVCAGSDSIPLHANLSGSWSGGSGLISVSGPDTLFRPTTAGTYTLVINRGAGVCRRADTTTIVVATAYPLTLNAPPVGCIEVDYTPDPFDPDVLYSINGSLQAAFPVLLDTAGSPYTISATANNVCGDVVKSVTLDIIAPVEVQIMAPNDTTLCSGTTALPLVASDTVGKWVGQHLVQTPQGPVFEPAEPGTYTLVFERGFGDCRRADTVVVRVEPGNGVQAGADLYVCNTQASLTLGGATPAGGGYTGFGLTGTVIDLTKLTLDSAYTYTYTVPTLPDACNDDGFTLTVAAPPSAGFSVSHDTTCIGQTVTITPVASGAVNFQVNWGEGPAGPALSYMYGSAGTFPIQFTASTVNPLTGGTLCTASGSASVHLIQPIVADSIRFTMIPDSGCGPLTVSFENFSKAEKGRYTWDFGNDSIFYGDSTGPITFAQGTEDTTYTVRLIVDTGCDSLVLTRTVKVFPQPHADFGISYLEPCSGGVLEASVLSTGNPLINIFYTSTGGLPDTAVLTKPSFFQFYTDSLPDTVGIWLVTANFCGVDTAYREVVVNPTDVVALIGLPDTTAICAGSPATFINYATTGAPITWAVSNTNTYLGDTIQVVFADSGTYSIALYAFGCGFDSIILPIQVLPLPTLDVVHDLTRCPDDPVSFQLSSDAPGIRLWFGDGDSTDQKTVQRVYPVPGTYNPRASAVSAYGCTASWSGSLTILAPPTAMATADDSLCAGAAAAFAGSSTIANSTCTWDFGDGNVADDCQAVNSYTSPGLFTAVLTVVSPEGCRGRDSLPIYVRNRPAAQFDFTVIQPCTPALVSFQSAAAGATGLTWSFGDGATSVMSAPVHPYDSGAAYTVRLIATNEGICSDTASRVVTVFQTPVFDFNIDVQCTIPAGTNLTVGTEPANHVTVTGPNYNLNGDFHPGLPTGNYDIRIVSAEGCQNDTTIFLLPPNELFLEVARDSFFVFLGDSIPLEAIVNQTAVRFQWTPPVYLDNDTVFNPVSTPFRSVAYVVEGTNGLGCTKTDSVWIDVRIDRDTGLYIPNAFTPNADNTNDVFYMRSSNPSVLGYDVFQVFDKYDEKVFDVRALPGGEQATPENPFFGWTGDFRGGKAEMGSYRYVIGIRYVDGETRVFTGTVQLIL